MAQQHPEYVSNVWHRNVFANKVVFCTGGAGTVCSAQVRALVYLGANACIVGRNVDSTTRVAAEMESIRPGAKVLGIAPVDVRDFQAMDAAVAKCAEELGGVDFLIAGAAGNFIASINQLSADAFRSVVEIDLVGSWHAFKAASPYLTASAQKGAHVLFSKHAKESAGTTGGRVVFVSATMHYTGVPFQTHVAAAKAGVDALSNNIALEFGPVGITSNIIAPGPIEGTEGVDRLFPSEDREASLRNQPLGRYGSVRDIADATVYLFCETGNYVSGTVLVVDGASWRRSTATAAGTLPYPDLLLANQPGKRNKSGSSARM
ncbi:hypothetical protein N7523_011148 [Penicillium sp. IBT 18751x]|nr:hypothetical protein N7523_011148 [Penicillium sp. IBT 18751x]